MTKLIFEDEDVENHANMDYQNGGHAQQNGIHAPVEAEDTALRAVLWCHWRGV